MRAPRSRLDALRRIASRLVAAATAAAHLTVVAGPGLADALDDAAARGQSLGRAIIPDVNAQVRLSEDDILKLFPGAAEETDVPLDRLFPSYGAEPLRIDPQTLFGDDAGLRAAGAEAGADLETSSAAQGEAWRAMTATRGRVGVDLGGDPMFDYTRDTLGALDRLAARFSECRGVSEWTPRDVVTRTTVERRCIRASAPTGAEIVNHALAVTTEIAPVRITIEPHAAFVTVDLATGVVRVDYEQTIIERDCREIGESERCVDRARSSTWSRTTRLAPRNIDAFCGPDADSAFAILREHVDITDVVRTIGPGTPPSCANGLVYRAPVTGPSCATYSRVLHSRDDDVVVTWDVCPNGVVEVDLTLTRLVEDRWWPQETVDGLLALQEGGCTPAYETAAGGRLDAGSCINTGGGRICHGDPIHALIDPPPFDLGETQVDRLATRVRADFSACAPVVPDAETCGPLKSDPSCVYRDTRPVAGDGVTDVTMHEDVYDCETSRTVASAGLVGSLSCPPPIRGIGEDLVTPIEESNSSFHEVAATLAALQFTAMDTACGDPADPSADPTACRVFDGEAMNCKLAAFGIVNCCDSPGGVSLAQYLQVAFAIGQLDSAMMSLDEGAALRGAWELAADPFHDAWAVVSERFASGVNSITGTTVFNTTEAGAKGLVSLVQDKLLQKTAEWAGAVLGDAANSLFVLAESGGPAFVGGVMQGPVAFGPELLAVYSVLNYVMLAYTIYNMALLVATIVWRCSERELELGVKRELKSCHANGSYCSRRVFGFCLERRRGYCCFSSPLSRIMQEQIRPLLGISWGSARSPQCGGLTLAQLQSVDFDRIDLSEWMDILLDEGVMPDGRAATLEALTGSGRTLADAMPAGVDRLNAVDRAVGRVDQVDTEDILQRAREGLVGDHR